MQDILKRIKIYISTQQETKKDGKCQTILNNNLIPKRVPIEAKDEDGDAIIINGALFVELEESKCPESHSSESELSRAECLEIMEINDCASQKTNRRLLKDVQTTFK